MITLQEPLKAMGWTPCLMLINTILVERTIEQQKLLDKLSFEDLRTLTLLFYEHVNPYGQYRLLLQLSSRWADQKPDVCAESITCSYVTKKCFATQGESTYVKLSAAQS